MKAEIENGNLYIIPESKTEDFAMDQWFKMQEINTCTGEVKTKKIFTRINKRKKSLKERIELWMLNNGLLK